VKVCPEEMKSKVINGSNDVDANQQYAHFTFMDAGI